ncbi:MAG: DUF2007 domain-containing protein [Xanthomonadales bacterium]|nr:DUF2007 domain-containing protein [Xanthomonadales bacterium]NIN58595.1 DUF2007 domain-containing protein [Xanthomonadales bacterium]NIN73884.1 DUF2007 domain-containing protein [Xanthomonadales bacterium]NIO12353.1 DUF2007 domain-containing protein [Xanthomonadales bacterium]NIP10988.1 DUF2007 domain-containing protein [Xanthomonadales bacterium]
MIKVYEDFDLSRVGQLQSLLESAGIRTLLKNQYVSSALGEIPFVEVMPELWVLEAHDLPRARQLIAEVLAVPEDQPGWTCRRCRTEVDGAFTHCWNCMAARSAQVAH